MPVKSRALPSYIYISLSVLWLYSGIVPILCAQSESLTMLARLGISSTFQTVLFLSSALLDVMFGLLILTPFKYHPKLWLAQLIVVVSYSVIIAIGLPEYWTHPFAPLIKNIPIIALLLFLYQYTKSNSLVNTQN